MRVTTKKTRLFVIGTSVCTWSWSIQTHSWRVPMDSRPDLSLTRKAISCFFPWVSVEPFLQNKRIFHWRCHQTHPSVPHVYLTLTWDVTPGVSVLLDRLRLNDRDYLVRAKTEPERITFIDFRVQSTSTKSESITLNLVARCVTFDVSGRAPTRSRSQNSRIFLSFRDLQFPLSQKYTIPREKFCHRTKKQEKILFQPKEGQRIDSLIGNHNATILQKTIPLSKRILRLRTKFHDFSRLSRMFRVGFKIPGSLGTLRQETPLMWSQDAIPVFDGVSSWTQESSHQFQQKASCCMGVAS